MLMCFFFRLTFGVSQHGLTVDNILKTPDEKINEMIYKVGFRNNKTKYLKQCCEILSAEYNGDIPPTAAEMIDKLPGVGPKMAYIVESIAHNRTTGIGVDTHMHRLFPLLKWVDQETATTPERTRVELEGWLPHEKWSEINVLFVGFGQESQQQKEKILRKALVCSQPREALLLLKRVGLDYVKEGKKYKLTEEIQAVMKKSPVKEEAAQHSPENN
jgi:endonuclease III